MTYYFLRLIWERKFFYINHRKRKVYPDLRPYMHSITDYIFYLEDIEKRKMVFEYYDIDLKKHSVSGDYYTRYHDRYIKSIYARFKKLESWVKKEFNGYFTLMTLTVRQRNKTIGQCLDDLQLAKKALIANLRKIRVKLGYLEYLWVIEPHKTGYPHCHFILMTEQEFKTEFETRLKSLWADKYGVGSSNWGLHLGSDEGGSSESIQIEYLAQYLFKYVSKTIWGSMNPAYLAFHAEIWRKYSPVKNYRNVEKRPDGRYKLTPAGRGSYRLWDCSRGLKQVMKREVEEDDFNNWVTVSVEKDGETLEPSYQRYNQELFLSISKRKKRDEMEWIESVSCSS